MTLDSKTLCTEAVREDGLLKAIGQYTWPGIELGHRPLPTHSFFEYVDALRLGDLERFLEVEKASSEWWFPLLDRGKGAILHFAAEAGQLNAVRFLIEERAVEVNQLDAARGQAPLHRVARMAHYTAKPYFEIFEYLLQHGADPSLIASATDSKEPVPLLTLVANKGRGWEEGEVKAKLQDLIAKHAAVPKRAAYSYTGPSIGSEAQQILEAWEATLTPNPPDNWRPPPTAGFQGARGLRKVSEQPWRQAGDDDGSCYLRPMTPAELDEQSRAIQAARLHCTQPKMRREF